MKLQKLIVSNFRGLKGNNSSLNFPGPKRPWQ